MLTPRDTKYAARLRAAVEEGKRLMTRETESWHGPPEIQGEDALALQAWLARAENILTMVFGSSGAQTRHFAQLMPKGGPKHVTWATQVAAFTGVLLGALEDLEGGFLANREMLLATELFDSIVGQAKHLLRQSYKDVAAVLGRVVVEDALRRIATTEGIDSTQKPAKINDELKTMQKFSQPQWRQVQAWLDIGNAAAHGKFDDYSAAQVEAMLESLPQFLASHLHA